MITRLRYPKGYQFFDANGAPLALGNLYYYVAGTTTPQDTFSDSAGTVVNTNPIVLDGSGRVAIDVYLGSDANYKEVLTTASATVSPWPDDNIPQATQADWNATSGPNQILNKPALAAVATSGSYTDLSGTPATDTPFTGDSGTGGASGLVPAPAAGDAVANKFLSATGGWVTPPGAAGSGATNLSVTESAVNVGIGSSSGTGVHNPCRHIVVSRRSRCGPGGQDRRPCHGSNVRLVYRSLQQASRYERGKLQRRWAGRIRSGAGNRPEWLVFARGCHLGRAGQQHKPQRHGNVQ